MNFKSRFAIFPAIHLRNGEVVRLNSSCQSLLGTHKVDVNIHRWRHPQHCNWAMKSGIKRVIIGTSAVENECRRARDRCRCQGRSLWWRWSVQATRFKCGNLSTAIYPIHRDGSMTGVDLEASIDLADMSGLKRMCVSALTTTAYGLLDQSALYTGNVDLKKALDISSHKDSFEAGLSKWKADQSMCMNTALTKLSTGSLAWD